MCGHDGLNAIFFQPYLQALEKCIACRAVERGEGFVEKQEPRCGRERAGEGHALRFAAGEVLRTARRERGCGNQGKHLFDTRGAGDFAQSIGHIGRDGKVREERGLLGNECGAAASRREMVPRCGIRQ